MLVNFSSSLELIMVEDFPDAIDEAMSPKKLEKRLLFEYSRELLLFIVEVRLFWRNEDSLDCPTVPESPHTAWN
jgi:hypothetical protein